MIFRICLLSGVLLAMAARADESGAWRVVPPVPPGPGGRPPFPPSPPSPPGFPGYGGCIGCSYSGDYYGGGAGVRRPAPPLRLQGQWRNGWWYY